MIGTELYSAFQQVATLFRSEKYEIDSFCVYIHTHRDCPEMDVLDIESLISMDIKYKKNEFEDIVEED